MNAKNTPHKWHLLVYFVSKHVTIIVVTIKLFPSINFLLSQLKYLMRLTYTLLVISLHKINKLVSFSAPLNTKREIVRASTNLSTESLAGRPERILTLSPAAVWTHSKSAGSDLSRVYVTHCLHRDFWSVTFHCEDLNIFRRTGHRNGRRFWYINRQRWIFFTTIFIWT